MKKVPTVGIRETLTFFSSLARNEYYFSMGGSDVRGPCPWRGGVESLLPDVFSSIYKVCSGSRLLSKSRELLQFAARSRGAGCEG